MRFLAKLLAGAALSLAAVALPATGAFASTGSAHAPSLKCYTDCGGGNGGRGGDPNGGRGGRGGDGGGTRYGCPPDVYTIPGGGGFDARHFTPIDCYPRPNPDPQPWCNTGWDSHSHGSYQAIRGNIRDCQPQGGGWNWEQGQNNWYDPGQNDWYYPVTGWTGGYQDNTGCWHYPSQHGFTDYNYVYPQHNNDYGRHNYCRTQRVTFYFASNPTTDGTWLLENGGPALHDGQQLKYDGGTWTVEQWDPAGHGSLTPGGTGPYFVLDRGAHTLAGNVHEGLQYAKTVCFDGHLI